MWGSSTVKVLIVPRSILVISDFFLAQEERVFDLLDLICLYFRFAVVEGEVVLKNKAVSKWITVNENLPMSCM